MSFVQPAWFWALLALPLLGALYWVAEHRSKQMLARIVAPRLRTELAAGVSYGKRRLRSLLMLLGMAALITAMARPQWGYEWQEARLKGRDVIIAVDVSKSMLANDLSPNRLARARLAAQDLVGLLEGDRVGLIAFAGSAFLQAPLTVDPNAVLTAIQELDTDLIPRGGTNIAAAIKEAIEAFGKGEGGDRALILFTDGEQLDADGVKEAEKAQKAGIKIFTVGVGSPEGSVIPLDRRGGGTDFVRDRGNEIVKSRLDEDTLKKIAEAADGFYSRLEGPSTMERIVKEGIKSLEETESDSKMSNKPIDRYQWPLGIGIGLLMAASMIGDRRRRPATIPTVRMTGVNKMAGAALALAVTLSLISTSAKASETPESLYAAGKYAEALKAYEEVKKTDPEPDFRGRNRLGLLLKLLSKLDSRPPELDFDIGAAAYKSKEYNKAMESFSQVLLSNDKDLREKAYYNLGNTLFQKGAEKQKSEEKIREWESSVQKYDDALRMNPENQDAKYNRDVVVSLIDKEKKKLEEQKKEQQKQDQQKQDEQTQDQQDQKQDQQQQQQQQQNGKQDQKQDQQKQDQKDQQKDGQKQEGGQKEEQQKDPQDQQGQSGQKDQQKQEQEGGEQNKNQSGKGEPKDEQKEGEGDQEKKQDQAGKKEEKEKSENGEGEDKKEEKGDSESAKNDPKDKKDGKESEQKKDKESGEGEEKKEEQQVGDPEGSEESRHGELQSAEAGEKKEDGKETQAAEETEEREGGGYTKREARQLLDSLQSEEDRIMLFDKKWREPVYKDW